MIVHIHCTWTILLFFSLWFTFRLQEKWFIISKLWDTLKHLKRSENLTKRWRVKKISKMKIYICFFTCRRFFTLFTVFSILFHDIISLFKSFLSKTVHQHSHQSIGRVEDIVLSSFFDSQINGKTGYSFGSCRRLHFHAKGNLNLGNFSSFLFFRFNLWTNLFIISYFQGYMRSVKSFNNVGRAEDEGQRGCAERALCEASAECVADAQGTSSIFCQLGS